jgi:hypothetical protein
MEKAFSENDQTSVEISEDGNTGGYRVLLHKVEFYHLHPLSRLQYSIQQIHYFTKEKHGEQIHTQ